MPLKKYDWSQVEQAFMSAADDGENTLKVMSERFVIPYQTVRRYAAANEWTRKRLNFIIPRRLREGLGRTDNPYVRAQIMNELQMYLINSF